MRATVLVRVDLFINGETHMEIIPRILGYTDKDMWEKCELLKKILDSKEEVTVGRGKATFKVMKNKYSFRKDEYNRIKNSVEHYKNLHMQNTRSIEFRPYQLDIITEGYEKLKKNRFLYLAMEVRTGKTLTSLGIAEKAGAKNVLFITKKKAISGIEKDYNNLSPSYFIKVINYESLHMAADLLNWDLIIVDEAHGLGAFPKPSGRAEQVKYIIKKYNPLVILLSGTPTPESYSQMYHQVYAIPTSPFSSYKNFYRFCDDYVKINERKINGLMIKDYSGGKETILDAMRPYTITYTQREAGFVSTVNETVLTVNMKQSTYDLIERLKRDLVIEGKQEVILADTPVKLLSKVHQLCSGTIKFESGKSQVLDTSKAEFIKEYFSGKKIGIFYKFKEELNALKQVFDDSLTTELDEFNESDKHIALQIVSGREGISLREADCLVYYNIDFSATSYWQSRDRMTTKDRPENDVYWVFANNGIEHDVYKAVTKKIDYTVNHFKRLLL